MHVLNMSPDLMPPGCEFHLLQSNSQEMFSIIGSVRITEKLFPRGRGGGLLPCEVLCLPSRGGRSPRTDPRLGRWCGSRLFYAWDALFAELPAPAHTALSGFFMLIHTPSVTHFCVRALFQALR